MTKKKENKKRELKKVGPLSFGKISGIFGFIFTLISSILLIALISIAQNLATGDPEAVQHLNLVVGEMNYLVLLVLTPLLYGVISFIMGALIALIYNQLVKVEKIGGIKIELN